MKCSLTIIVVPAESTSFQPPCALTFGVDDAT